MRRALFPGLVDSHAALLKQLVLLGHLQLGVRLAIGRHGQVFANGDECVVDGLDGCRVGTVGGVVVDDKEVGNAVVLPDVLLRQGEQVFLVEDDIVMVALAPNIQQPVFVVEPDLDVALLGGSHEFDDVFPKTGWIKPPLDLDVRAALVLDLQGADLAELLLHFLDPSGFQPRIADDVHIGRGVVAAGFGDLFANGVQGNVLAVDEILDIIPFLNDRQIDGCRLEIVLCLRIFTTFVVDDRLGVGRKADADKRHGVEDPESP